MLSKGLQNFAYRRYVTHWNSDCGGYPPDINFLPGHVVIAEPDPGKDNARAMLTVLTNKEVRAWHKRTKRLVKQDGMKWDDAVMETE